MTPNSIVLYRSDTPQSQSGTSSQNGRDKKRLERAREAGYLDARCRNGRQVTESFGLWCWRLKIPMVWLERNTPRSKFGRVHLEMFTTTNRLSTNALSTFQALGAREVSAYVVRFERVPLKQLTELARLVFRAATRAGASEPNRSEPSVVASQAASA